MPPKSVKRALNDALEDLTGAEVKKFCAAIVDRDGEPHVGRGVLENLPRHDIVDKLVQIFTEANAIPVAQEALRAIGCNEQRKKLGECLQASVEAKVTGEPTPTFVHNHADIMKVETTGASMQTAQQDKLKYAGIKASYAMAETDLVEMNNYKSTIQSAARKKRVDPALIAAIISRSCRAGKTLTVGRGCYNKERRDYDTFGLMQLDVNPKGGGHKAKGAWDSEEHLCQGIDILTHFMLRIKHAFPDWSKEQQLKGGIAAYNAGDGNIYSYKEVDAKTSGGDYSNDVVARAQWYKTEGGF